MLSPEQESNLVSQGDCFEHYHSQDRVPTHEFKLGLDYLETSLTVADGTTTLTGREDYVLVDTTSGAATIVLPDPVKRGSVTVVKLVAANTVTVDSPTGTINGGATYSLTSAYATAKFKAIGGNYYKVA
jgi:hypothetical protein